LDYFCGGAGASDEHACIALSHVLWSIPGGAEGAPLTPSADCGGGPDGGVPSGGGPPWPWPPSGGAGTPLSLKHWANASWAEVEVDDDATVDCAAGAVLDEHAVALPINAAAAAPKTATRTGLL